MTLQEAILSSIAPVLALGVELWNPIRVPLVAERLSGPAGLAHSFVERGVPPAQEEAQLTEISEQVAKVAYASTKIYASVLTWVGVTAGLTPISIEVWGAIPTLVAVAIWIFGSGIFAVRAFSKADYYELGGFLFGQDRVELLAKLLICIDFVVLLIIWLTYNGRCEGSECPAIHRFLHHFGI